MTRTGREDVEVVREQGSDTVGGSHSIPPPRLPERRWKARHEDRAIRWGRWVLWLVLLGLAVVLALNWWIVQAYLIGREQALTDACADSPFAQGTVLAAGGPEAIDVPDHPALDAYRGDPEGRTEASLRVRDYASLAGDDALAGAAIGVTVAGPFQRVADIADAEAGCAHYLDAGS